MENGNKIDELIKRGVFNTPLLLLSIKNNDIKNICNYYLPYSVGIEIECNK